MWYAYKHMRVIILYRPQSEHERRVEEFVHDFKSRHEERYIEQISMDTVEGDELARVYGVMRFPAVMALGTDGQLVKLWDGEQLPLINEVAYYETI